MCKAYGGEPFVDLLRSFLSLGRTGDWLTLSNRGGADVPKALIKPVTHLENWKDSLFYIENKIIPSKYPELLLEDNKVNGSLSAKSVNNETSIIDAEPISIVLPLNVADNIIDSINTSSDDELPPMHPSTSSFLEAPVQASKVSSDASTPLDVDSDPDIHSKFEPVYGVFGQVNGLHNEYGMLLLKERKLANYEQTLSILYAKVKGLESERERLKAFEIQVLQEIDSLRQDKAAIVSKVVPNTTMKLVHSDEMGVLVSRLVRAAIIHGRCATFVVPVVGYCLLDITQL
ncbi:hypothetical protein Tco_0863902 [Tanacetum coccineum]